MTVCSDVVSCKPVMSVQCVVVRAIFCSLCLSSRHVKVMVFPVSQGSVKHSRRFIILKLDVTSSEQFLPHFNIAVSVLHTGSDYQALLLRSYWPTCNEQLEH